MSGGLVARHVEASDFAAWQELWQGYLSFYEVTLPEGMTELTWHRLLDPQFDMHGLIAIDGAGRAVGICTYLFHPSTWSPQPYCYLEDLFVAEAARGKGAGRAMIELVYAAADARGSVETYWMTHETNADARKLYDRVARHTGFLRYVR